MKDNPDLTTIYQTAGRQTSNLLTADFYVTIHPDRDKCLKGMYVLDVLQTNVAVKIAPGPKGEDGADQRFIRKESRENIQFL
ncbi:MAG TPA: hypothetical protein PKG95_06875 [Anaerolineaceae bacterium]|nr:hypothetical protein [Anaerolineaceae bacterium]